MGEPNDFIFLFLASLTLIRHALIGHDTFPRGEGERILAPRNIAHIIDITGGHIGPPLQNIINRRGGFYIRPCYLGNGVRPAACGMSPEITPNPPTTVSKNKPPP